MVRLDSIITGTVVSTFDSEITMENVYARVYMMMMMDILCLHVCLSVYVDDLEVHDRRDGIAMAAGISSHVPRVPTPFFAWPGQWSRSNILDAL